jgi:glycosyltransferase involved in cell wall biosynthesis
VTKRLVHFLGSLEVGGKERVALQLARRARAAGWDPELFLFDAPYRGPEVDLDPGDLPVDFLARRPGFDLRLVLGLARHWRRSRPQLVHAHNDTGVFYACAAALLTGARGPAVCATFHNRPLHDTPNARRLTRWAARRADRITAVSDELAEQLVADGWVTRCRTLWNGVDLDEFTAEGPTDGWRERLNVPPHALLVGHIGRFAPVKRHVDLLAAARVLADRAPPMVFVLVGQGPLHDEIEALAAGAENVRFVPRVTDVPAFLRELDLFVLSSDHEAAPRAVLEAMACGRPIVATEVGGVPRLLVRGAGVLVRPRDPSALADAILALARSPEERRLLGEGARVRSERFSTEDEWRAYAKLYADALGDRGASA